jgi:hypothetical protein
VIVLKPIPTDTVFVPRITLSLYAITFAISGLLDRYIVRSINCTYTLTEVICRHSHNVKPKYNVRCSIISQTKVLVTRMPEPPCRLTGQWKTIVSERCAYTFWALLHFARNTTTVTFTAILNYPLSLPQYTNCICNIYVHPLSEVTRDFLEHEVCCSLWY